MPRAAHRRGEPHRPAAAICAAPGKPDEQVARRFQTSRGHAAGPASDGSSSSRASALRPCFPAAVADECRSAAALAYLSFTDYELGALESHFLGLKNFHKALAGSGVPALARQTFVYVAIVLPGGVGLGSWSPILLHERTRTRWFYEVIYFLPVTSTLIAMATMWQFLLHPASGRSTACSSIGLRRDPRS